MAQAPVSLAASMVNVLVSPREAFAIESNHLRGWLLLLIVVIGVAAPQAGFLWSERGRQTLIDDEARTMQGQRARLTPRQYEARQTRSREYRESLWYSYSSYLAVTTATFVLFVSWVFCYTLPPMSGTTAGFSRVLLTVSLASTVFIIESVNTTLLNYVTGSTIMASTLGALVPVQWPAFVGDINPFTVWWVLLVAVGLAGIFRTRPRNVAVALMAVYLAVLTFTELTRAPATRSATRNLAPIHSPQ